MHTVGKNACHSVFYSEGWDQKDRNAILISGTDDSPPLSNDNDDNDDNPFLYCLILCFCVAKIY